jgi:hypothetical protein
MREEIDRRALIRGILCGAAVAAAGRAVGSETANAIPLDDRIPAALHDSVKKAQVWVGPGPRRVRRCWWRRGRRVCGWRWV